MTTKIGKASLLLMLMLLSSFLHLVCSAPIPTNVFVTGSSNIRSLAFDRTTNTLYVGDWSSGNIYPINLIDNSIGATIATSASSIGALAFDSATNTLYAGDFYSGDVYPINTIDNSIGTTITTGAGMTLALYVNPATNTLYVGDLSGTVNTINTIDNSIGPTITTGAGAIFALSFDPATNILYAGDLGSGNIYPINTIDNSVGTAIATVAPAIGSLSFDPATNILYTGAWGTGTIYSINTIDNSIGTVITTGSYTLGALYINSTTNTLYVGDGNVGAVYVISLFSNTPNVIIPKGVLYYMPAYLSSTSTTAMDANTQAQFHFDAGAYQSREASNMQNFVVFDGVSGSPYDCWLAGNVLNEQQTSNLYTSNILGIWCTIPESGWLVDNSIYFGFYSTSTNNFNSIGSWGESPVLSSAYAQYDNGALVFPTLYQNFAGTSTPSGWVASGVTQDNGVIMTSGNILTTSNFGLDWTQLLEMEVTVPTATTGHLEAFGYIGSNGINGAAIDYADQAASNTFVLYANGVGSEANAPTTYTQGSPSLYTFYLPANYVFASAQDLEAPNANAYFEYPSGSGGTASPIGMSAIGAGNPGLFLQWARIRVFQPDGNMPLDFYGPLITAPSVAITSGPSSPTADVGQYETFTATASNGNGPYTYNWLVVNSISNAIVKNYMFTNALSTNTLTFPLTSVDVSNSPEKMSVTVTDATPNTYNSIYSGAYVVDPAISITSAWSSNNIADQSQYETITGSWTGGTSPYTANFYITNTINGNVISGVVSAATSPATFTFQVPQTNNALGAPQIKFTVTDGVSGSASTTNTFGVNSLMSSLSTSGGTIDNGQSYTIPVSWTGGTPNFAVTLFSGSSSTCSSDTTVANTASGVSDQSTTFVVSPSSSTYYCIGVNDSASVANTANQVTAVQIVVNPAISITSAWSSNNIADQSQYETITGSWTGGTSPYTANFYITNTINGNVISGVVSAATSPATFTFQVPQTNNALGAPQIKFTVTDGVSGSASTTNTFGVNSLMSSLSTSGGTIDNGQSYTIPVSWTGGTPNFAVTLFSGSSSTCSSDTTVANTASGVSDQSTTFVVSPSSSTYYCIGVNDSASVANTANQVTAVQIVVNPAISITSAWSSNNIADQSQYETITGSWTGGTSPYTANFYITNTINGNVIANSLMITTSPATFTFRVPQTNNALGAPQIKFTVTDGVSGSASTTNTFGVNSLMSSLSTSGGTIDNGQSYTIPVSWTGGTPNFAVTLFSGSSSTCSSDTTVANTASGISGHSTTFVASPTSSTYYCIGMKDSATTAMSANQFFAVQIVVNAAPSISQPTPTSAKVDVGQTQTITATITGGTPSYIGNAIITNTGSITNTITMPNQTGTSLSSTWTTASNEIGTETGNFVMSDSVSTSFNSIPSTSWTMYNTLSSLTTTGATIANGQSNTITANWTGGAPNFAVTLFSGSSSTCSSDTTVANTASGVSGQSTTFVVSPTISTYYCIGVKDSATTAVSANQVTAAQIVVFVPQTSQTTILLNGAPANSLGVNVTNNVPVTTNILGQSFTFTTTNTAVESVNVVVQNITSSSPSNPGHSAVEVMYVNPASSNDITVNAVLYYSCSVTSAPTPFISKDGGATWSAITPTSVSTTAPCSVSFSFNGDPIVGLFSVQPSSGGSSTGWSSSGGSGAGGPIGPVVTKITSSCYEISNMSVPNSKTVSLNGTSFEITASSIGSSSASLIINGITYLLMPNNPARIGTTSAFNFTAMLKSISYLPILHTVTVDICSVPIATITSISTTTITPTTTTIISTTIPATTSIMPTTTVPYAQKYGAFTWALIGGIIVIVIMAGAIYYLLILGKKNKA